METKEPDSRLSVRKEDLEDQELYNLNKIINDLYSKITTARDETDDAVKKFTRSGVISSVSDQSAASLPPPIEGGIPQPQASDWTLNSVVYSAGEDGLQYGFASASISNKPAVVDYYSMFIQDYSSGYVNTSGTAVTLTSASKEAGNTFENCVAGQVININSVAYTIAANPTTPFESLTLTTSAGTQTNVYFNLNPVDGKWEEIASDAEAGTWQLRPPTGWDVPCCLTASTKDQKTYQPPDGVNYKRLQFAAWGDAPQVTNFSVAVEQQDLSTTDIPSGKFVVNFTKPLDPEYYYTSIERLWYINAPNPTPPYWVGTQNIGATARVDVNTSNNTITYNGSSNSPTFTGQYFTHIQPGDTVYVGGVSTLTDANSYIVSEVISNTQLKLTTSPPSGTNVLFAQWGRMAGEVNPFTQVDYWPLPTSPEYWKFRARSVNHREVANNTAPPETAVTVPASGGITPLTPATQPGSGDWSLNALQYSTDEAGNSSIFISATVTTPSAGADYYSLFWQKTSTPVSGDWIEIAADATAGTWQEWPSAGATYVVAIAANKNTYKLDQPDESVPSYYKTLTIPAWGAADQVTGFSVTVETDDRAGVPSGRFVFSFTKPSDPDYYYVQISRIATNSSYTPLPGAVYGIVAGEVNPTKQTDWWPLPETAEYWTFKAESVNYRKAVNTTAAPTSNVSVSTSSGITQIAPATITTAAFASTIRPVDLVTTAGIGVTSIVVSSNTGTVTTASAHGLASGRQVAIYGGTGTSAKLNGLYSITVTGGSTFTITTSGVSNGTYSAGLNEVPLPALPSATYPSGATAFVTANTKLYRSSGTAWTIAADGSDITANSITAGQIAAGAISTTELFAGEILVGQGSGKPTLFKVVDSSSNMIGFIGDITTPTYPVNFVGAYFVNLRIGPNISTPIVSASSSGVSINGATFALTANGITTTIDNTASGGYTAGLRIANATATKLIQVGLSGSSTPSILLNDTTSGSPSAILEVTTGSGGRLSATDLSGTSGVELVGQYSTYTTGTWRGSITTGRIEATREFKLGSSATAGYVLTADAQGVGTWQAAPSGYISSINSMTGPAITIAAGSGISIANATNTVTITNSGVTSIAGTTNQVIASASTGSVTLSLPQSIATTSAVTFGSVTTATVGPTTATALNLRTDNTTRWSVSSTGMLIPALSDTYDIGNSYPNRVRTVYAQYVDTYSAGVPGGFVRSAYYKISDITGLSGEWEMSAVASASASSLSVKDNSGSNLFTAQRQLAGSPVNYIKFTTTLLPTTGSAYDLGDSSLRWNFVYAGTVNSTVVTSTNVNSTGSNAYQVSSTTVIDSSRNASFVNLALTGSFTAGGSTGTSGQVLTSTGTGVQWAAAGSSGAAGSTGYVQFNTSGALNADADFFWDNSLKRLGVGTTSPQYPVHVRKDQNGFTWIGVSNEAAVGASAGLVCKISGTNFCTFSQDIAGDTRFSNGSSTGQNIYFSTNALDRWAIRSTGHFTPQANDLFDIGILSTNRVRAVYAKTVDTAVSGGTGDYIQTRKIQLFDNTGSTSVPSFWDLNAVVSGIGAFSESYFYVRDNSGAKVFQSERVRSGVAVDRTYWYTDLLPDSNGGQNLGSSSFRWNDLYCNTLFVNNTVISSLIPSPSNNYDLGSVTLKWSSVHATNINGYGYIKGASTSAYIDTDFNTSGQSPYRLRGSSLIDNGGVWISAGGVNMNAGCAATGYNIFGGGTGQTATLDFTGAGGFTVGVNTYNKMVFTGGVLTAYTL